MAGLDRSELHGTANGHLLVPMYGSFDHGAACVKCGQNFALLGRGDAREMFDGERHCPKTLAECADEVDERAEDQHAKSRAYANDLRELIAEYGP